MGKIQNGGLLCILFFFSLMGKSTKSRDLIEKDFDLIYYRVFMESRTDKMLKIGDSLYRASTTQTHKIKSTVIIATAYSQNLSMNKSIVYWKKVDSMATKANLYDWVTFANERLANEYLKLNLVKASKQFMDRAEKSSKSLSGSTDSKYIYAMMLETKALQRIWQNDTANFIKGIKTNQAYLRSLSKNDVTKVLLGKSYLKTGEVYAQKNSIDSANYYLCLAENEFGSSTIKTNVRNSSLCRVFGNLARKKKQYKEAEVYLLQAKEIAFVNKDRKEMDLIINDLRRYYREVHNYRALFEINKIKDSLDHIKNFELVEITDRDFANEYIDKNRFKSYTYVLIVLLVFGNCLVVILMIFFKRNNKLQIINQLNYKRGDSNLSAPTNNNLESKNGVNIQMSADKEKDILRLLADFESKYLYLNKDISRPKMASFLKTNTKYLSFIIKKYRTSDFNDYINHYRIKYIINKLYTEPAYRNYKISYLAEICGYSSHSRFADVFKQHMKIPPSEFIMQLRNHDQSHQS
ncbi:AraC family transcriptional regulator [Chryseobacterium daecheongense]|nr:AraC family transcriptional regulator [Chryseobacterium daecheongense]